MRVIESSTDLLPRHSLGDQKKKSIDSNDQVVARRPYKVFLETDRHVFYIEIITGIRGKRWANFGLLYQYKFSGYRDKSYRALDCGDPPVALFDQSVAEVLSTVYPGDWTPDLP